MSLVIGDTPEQLQQGLLIDGELWTALRIAELQAQVNALRDGVKHFNRSGGDMNPLLKAYINTPAQCLAEIRAQAGCDGYIKGANDWCASEYESCKELLSAAEQHGNQLRQAAKVSKL
ncbi:hypothetical protein [Alishewanella phage vB_AspM_Slickus01]|nr:hypothetical protein [Alishewanella phage vB_AspM_Slickus01]